jgi:hypothetical protein
MKLTLTSSKPSAPSQSFEETRESLNPRAKACKDLEMAVRRADAFASLCQRWTASQGPLARYHVAGDYDSKLRKLWVLVDKNYKSNLVWTDPDEWLRAYDYWANGGHDRTKTSLLIQLPDTNRKAIAKNEKAIAKI